MKIVDGLLNKSYEKKKILSNLDLTIEKGEIYLIIGRNGIGKSTLLRLLARVEKADAIFSHNINETNISHAPSNLVYYKYMKVSDLLTFYRKIYLNFDYEYSVKHMKLFKIDMNSKIRRLSDGDRKIINFVICLSFNCMLYVIDEPFPNVDLLNDELFRSMIINRFDSEVTFVIATHQINEFEKIAGKCILLKDDFSYEIFHTDDIRNQISSTVEDYFKEVLR